MDVSIETLKKTIGRASDEELLRRWGAQLFTEEALPIAEAELLKRGLDFSLVNISRVNDEQKKEAREARSIRFVKLLTSVLVAAGCAGFALRLGVIGVLIGAVLAWPLGTWIAKEIDRRVETTWLRFALSITSVALTLFASLIASLLIGAIFTAASNDSLKPTQKEAATLRSFTEADLRLAADAQNKTLPAKTSDHLELTRVDVGPGMRVTYQVRVLIEGFSKESLSESDIAMLRRDGIEEGCEDFRVGLNSGVSYVMAYNAPDGSNIFRFPITSHDCLD